MLDIENRDYRREPDALATNGARDERDFCRLQTGIPKTVIPGKRRKAS
jgi:hypothetical protein